MCVCVCVPLCQGEWCRQYMYFQSPRTILTKYEKGLAGFSRTRRFTTRSIFPAMSNSVK